MTLRCRLQKTIRKVNGRDMLTAIGVVERSKCTALGA